MPVDDDFTPLEAAAWGDLLGIYGRLIRRIDMDLQANFRITHAEFEVLLRLSWTAQHRMRIHDIAAQSLLTRSGISRLIDRLAQAGYVVREEAIEDRRGSYAVLTPAGYTHFRAALKAHVAFVRRHFLAFFTDNEQRQMAQYWRRILEHEGR
jgi:DNA-binding MarR family transcriptional regulator